MTPNFSNSVDLLLIAKEKLLYEKLVAQLKKDFDLANLSLDFKENINPLDLKIMLHEKIYYLILEKFSEYLNLLYVIDVPESAFKDIRVSDVVEVSEQVSFLILKREWQKVWHRKKYS